ncbi:MFS transporter OS=Streptomyces cyaneofuscatus OX=66883 GN=G3I52_27885 PE=4 SV=1 [Streptomyces cyaneofuscatus]
MVDQAQDAFVTGLRVVAVTAALLHIVLGLLTLRRVPKSPKSLEDEGGAGRGGEGDRPEAAGAEASGSGGEREAAMP